MAINDPVVQILEVMPPQATSAAPDVRAGGSTPAEGVQVWDYDATTIEYTDFKCKLHGYDGGGLTFTLPWSATTATSGETGFEIGIRRMNDDAEDIDAAHTYAFNVISGGDTAPSLSGELSYPTITFTDGPDMDSWADEELAIVRVRRNTAAPDDMAGDAELWGLFGKETA